VEAHRDVNIAVVAAGRARGYELVFPDVYVTDAIPIKVSGT
jgi:hypothetical protein